MQSGRSWANPARRRGSSLPVQNTCIHVTRQTTTARLRHDNITAEYRKNSKAVETVITTTIILIHREDITWCVRQNNSEQDGGGRLVTLDSCDSQNPFSEASCSCCPRLTPEPPPSCWGHRILEDSARSDREALSLCKDDFSLFVLQ